MKIFLTGKPGVGKTTIIKKFVESFRDTTIGFWTEEVRDKTTHQRIGFKIVDTFGNESIFASKNFNSDYIVGSYKVDLYKFESIALKVIYEALNKPHKIIVIDEIGKMELFSKNFVDLVLKIVFDEKLNFLATLPIRDVHPVMKKIREMKNIKIFEVTFEKQKLYIGRHNKTF
jgi:nucleoside-triphosphatase